MRVGVVALALIPLALGLSGCLVSEGPLIGTGEAAFPLPDRASAERLTLTEGKWTHQSYDTAYRSGSGYIVKGEDSDEEMVVTLK
ncbi:MAG TPA: hypothetical protein VF213_01070, partial [Dongiaceae bacterium]